MSKAFIHQVIRDTVVITHDIANELTDKIIDSIVHKIKTDGRFTLPKFGTFVVRETSARNAMNPRTQEKIKIKAGRTVKFKVSPWLRKDVNKMRKKHAKG